MQGSSTSCASTVTSGACSFYSNCTTTTPTGVSAGTLTISGGNLGTGIAVTPGANNQYTYTASSSMFSAGQTLTVSASGATIPAFGPESVTAPAFVVVTSPAAAASGYTIPTSADLTVKWTGGQIGAQVLVEGAAGSGATYFTCTWDAALGQAVVPKAVLAGLAGQTSGFFVAAQLTTTTFTAGGYSISESALPFSGAMATYP